MGEDKQQDFKKGFPNNIVWFLLAIFLLALTVQNFLEMKFAKVGFSYQLENLVNLQLIQPEDSRKTALNDNLVTFSGKFRDRLTDEGKNRYKYLELLNSNHELIGEKDRLTKELSAQKIKIKEAADWFLHLSGIPMPKSGYVIVDSLYTNPDNDLSVSLTELSPKNVVSLDELNKKFEQIGATATVSSLQAYGKELSDFITNVRSPMLGIGNEALKQKIKEIDVKVGEANNSESMSIADKTKTYGTALASLQSVMNELNQMEDHVRLTKLRSVRRDRKSVV